MALINDGAFPQIIMDALTIDTYNKGGADLSATELLRSPRVVQLERRHKSKFVVPASSVLKSFVGTAIHDALEKRLVRTPNKPYLVERRFHEEFDGVNVGGKFDAYIDKCVYDFKTTSVWKRVYGNGEFPEWEQQLNIYGYLMQKHGIPVDYLSIIAWYTDWDARRSAESGDYPASQIEEIRLPLWSMEKAHAFIAERVALQKKYFDTPDNELPHCTDADMWVKPLTYAIKELTASRAMRVFKGPTAKEDAVAFMAARSLDKAKFDLEVRGGERSKCLTFCHAAPFCNQWADYVATRSKT